MKTVLQCKPKHKEKSEIKPNSSSRKPAAKIVSTKVVSA